MCAAISNFSFGKDQIGSEYVAQDRSEASTADLELYFLDRASAPVSMQSIALLPASLAPQARTGRPQVGKEAQPIV